MITQPWAIAAWPQVAWTRQVVSSLEFAHLSTQVLPALGQVAGHRGQTVWWASHEGHDGAIAWDWVQVRGGVCLVDPMTLVSNISLLDQSNDEPQATDPDAERIVALNERVHQLAWQDVVGAVLRLNPP